MTAKFARLCTFIVTMTAFSMTAQAKPDEATDAQVQNCQFLSEVTGSSGYGKNAGWKPIAKTHAEQKAGTLGATHIVWSNFRSVGAFNGDATARAYNCHR
ncbi:hypothetical protein [Methyloterricola oryzae]|uniref:hypothetical protein n=1 Tax=Methyloterricola oryzae TaxID=1495050 RepID=UPI0005EB0ED5|nr:hypothetical protein [Methyloterricola oryzae]